MLQPLFDSTTLSLLEKAAVFGERRQQVLAGNIANIDTPEYRPHDLPVEKFQQALRDAIAARHAPASAGTLAAPSDSSQDASGAVADFFPDELFRAVEAAPANITFQDANNRSVEREVMEMTKNAMMQSFAVELMHAQLNLLQSVISERP